MLKDKNVNLANLLSNFKTEKSDIGREIMNVNTSIIIQKIERLQALVAKEMEWKG